MVKKMVSKKIHSSENSNSSRYKSKEDDVPPQADSKPAAELLNIAAPTNNSNDDNIQVQRPAEPPKAPLTTQPSSSTPMFMDDIVNLDTTIQKPESQLPKILAIAICLIILLFWMTVVIISTHINIGPKIMEKNITYTTYVQINNSYENWTKVNHNIGESFMMQGFLREEVLQINPTTQTITYYLVDDYSNKIKLDVGYAQQSSEYKKLFVINNNTKGTYNVSGTVDVKSGFIIIVTDITAQQKSLYTVTKVQVQNMTVEGSGVKFDLSQGWNKVSTMLFGAPKLEEVQN